MQIKVNDYEETEHFRAICEDCYNISRTCGYDRLTIVSYPQHKRNSFCGIREADYYIAGRNIMWSHMIFLPLGLWNSTEA